MKPVLYLFFFCALYLPLNGQWSVFTPDIPDTVGINHVHAVSAEVAWAIAIQYEVDSTGFDLAGLDKGYFFRTTDGGTTWTPGLVPMGDFPFLSAVHGMGANAAWVVGVDLASGLSHVVRTSDGGLNWTPITNIPFTPFASWPNIIHFQDALNGVIMSDPTSSPATAAPHFEIYRTTNGGDTWTRVSAANIPEPLEEEFGVAAAYDAIGSHVWFGTSEGRVFRSSDSGASWQSTDTGLEFVNFLSFANTLTGIAATPPYGIVLTEDGGQTWTDITPEGDFTFFVSAAMIPESEYILVVTADNFVSGPFTTRISPDKGATWLEIGSGEEAGSAQFFSPTAGFAGEWQPTGHRTRLYSYEGSPLTGLLRAKPLATPISVYPNPAQAQITVTAPQLPAGDYLLLLHDTQGRLLLRENLKTLGDPAWQHHVEVASLPTGTYLLTLSSQEGVTSAVVMKQ